jgi:hypothetical protein
MSLSLTWLVDQQIQNLTGAQFKLAAYLYRRLQRKPELTIRAKDLAKATGLSEKSVRSTSNHLAKQNLLDVTGGPGTTNTYRLSAAQPPKPGPAKPGGSNTLGLPSRRQTAKPAAAPPPAPEPVTVKPSPKKMPPVPNNPKDVGRAQDLEVAKRQDRCQPLCVASCELHIAGSATARVARTVGSAVSSARSAKRPERGKRNGGAVLVAAMKLVITYGNEEAITLLFVGAVIGAVAAIGEPLEALEFGRRRWRMRRQRRTSAFFTMKVLVACSQRSAWTRRMRRRVSRCEPGHRRGGAHGDWQGCGVRDTRRRVRRGLRRFR